MYANTSHSVLDKLCKLNNKLLRVLSNATLETPLVDFYISFDLLPIPLLFEFKMLVFMFVCIYHRQKLPGVFHSYFKFNSDFHNYNTRQNSSMQIASVQSNTGQRQTSYCASSL